jgi:hypothetical protein
MSKLSKLLMKPHVLTSRSANRVTRTCCGKCFSTMPAHCVQLRMTVGTRNALQLDSKQHDKIFPRTRRLNMQSLFIHRVHLLRRVTLAVQTMPSIHSVGIINTRHLNSCIVRKTGKFCPAYRLPPCNSYQARSQWDTSGSNARTTNMDAPIRNSQNIETNMLIGRLKTCDDAPPHSRVAAVGPSWLERTHFQKCVYMQGAVCDVKQLWSPRATA